MKKIFCLIITALLLFSVSLAADVSVTAIGGSGLSGTKVDLRLFIENDGINSLSLDVTYDKAALLLYDIQDENSENADHGKVENAYQLSWEDAESVNTVVLTFIVKPDAPAGSYQVSVKSGDTLKATANILVTEENIKDVNGDEEVDSDDADYIARYAVKADGYTENISPKGDVNGDGLVNLLDAICLERSVEGLSGYQYGVERDENDPIPDIESDFGN